MTGGLIFYIIVYIAVHLFLTFQFFFTSGKLSIKVTDSESAATEEPETGTNIKDEEGSIVRKILIIFYLIFVSIFAFVFVGIIAAA